ncbi:phosphotransferase [Streptomyces coelicoflavus]|uniref:phosphotransferase n=1 Tax=Streptomyces coelicoflavus TaxID=285562 RepID=UPI00210CC671|nr:phosphotransferase [Streptomyces coelicoflavus]MCQ4201167.1 phosphotransferase [Streptomyces coelicoflavus]
MYPDPRKSPQGLVQSAANLARAYDHHRRQVEVEQIPFWLGAGLNGLAKELTQQGRESDAVLAFQVAHLVLIGDPGEGAPPQHVDKAAYFSRRNLQSLGATTVTALPDPVEASILDLSDILTDGEPAQVQRTEREPGQGRDVDGPRHGSSEQELATAGELVTQLARGWTPGRVPIDDLNTELLDHFCGISGQLGALDRDLGREYRTDVEAVTALFPEGMPEDRHNLEALAQRMRRFAFESKTLEEREERRVRWLASATTNYRVWKMPGGIPTNGPQVIIDLMGYIGAILSSEKRYQDSARDLLLDCTEAQVCLAHRLPAVVLGRFPYLRAWLLASVGTYLMLAGPNPSRPQDSYYDPRIHSDDATSRGLHRAQREQWPEILLRQWRDQESRKGACFALASVSGWDEVRAQWLVERIFEASHDDRKELDRNFWSQAVEELMSAARKVRVATNPWSHEESGSSRGNVITSDDAGRLRIPSPVLQAAVAQGLSPGDVITVHGNLFKGRRMPTFLLTNRYGPLSILKVDYRDKVVREVTNFKRYAKRLHQSNRPSECASHAMEMYLGENGDPLRAIETAYAFEEGEKPLTLSSWIQQAGDDDAKGVVDRLLLNTMRPWIAHVRRDRIDLRAEYPVFRPGPASDKQSPDSWAKGELSRITDPRVLSELGAQLTADSRSVGDWVRKAPGLPEAMAHIGNDTEWINPLWFAAELAEVGSGALTSVIDSFQIGLRDFDTLLALSHGDLHFDNVLCTSGGHLPKAVLIDFESAHYGHVCKDLARLEASMLCQVFTWDQEAAARLAIRIADGCFRSDATLPLPEGDGDSLTHPEHVALTVSQRIRETAEGCGQGHWPIRKEEYHLALAGALIPMARYTTMSVPQRWFALTLSTILTSALLHHWKTAEAEGVDA